MATLSPPGGIAYHAVCLPYEVSVPNSTLAFPPFWLETKYFATSGCPVGDRDVTGESIDERSFSEPQASKQLQTPTIGIRRSDRSQHAVLISVWALYLRAPDPIGREDVEAGDVHWLSSLKLCRAAVVHMSMGYGEVTVKLIEFDFEKGRDPIGSPVSTNTLAVTGVANKAAGITPVS